jgi:aubergine
MNNKRYDKDRVNEEFKGMTVVTSYSKAGKHTYKIDRVDFDKTPQDTFERKEGTISFADYFK